MPRKTKILTVNTSYERGGAAKIASTIHRALNSMVGYQSVFAHGRGRSNQSQRTVRISVPMENGLHALITRLTGLQGIGSWLSTRRCVDMLRSGDFSIVHLHNIHGYFLDWKFFHALKTGKWPTVWTLHDAWAFSGRCASSIDCEKWETGCGGCPYKRNYPKAFLDTSRAMWHVKRRQFARDWSPVIVTPSEYLGKKIERSFLRNAERKVVPNGVDTMVFRPMDKEEVRRKLGIPIASKVVAFCASKPGEIIKGSRYFGEMLSAVRHQNVVVLVIGAAGIDIDGSAWKGKVIQMGYIQDAGRLAEVYNAADVYCITSLDETFPTTVLEAMACGTPVAGFAVGGVTEQVGGVAGLLVESKNVSGLARAIERLLENSDARLACSHAGRERVLDRYSVEGMVEGYIHIYETLLERIPQDSLRL